MSGSTVVTAVFTVKEELLDEFKEWCRGDTGLKVTRGFKGCRSVEVSADHEKPNTLHLYCHWASKDDHNAYFAYRMETGLADLFDKFLAAPPVITWYDRDETL